jgi:hypothetical protein
MNKNELVTVLTTTGMHSRTTREELVSGMKARGVDVEIVPGRIGYDHLKFKARTIARIFANDLEMLAWKARFEA